MFLVALDGFYDGCGACRSSLRAGCAQRRENAQHCGELWIHARHCARGSPPRTSKTGCLCSLTEKEGTSSEANSQKHPWPQLKTSRPLCGRFYAADFADWVLRAKAETQIAGFPAPRFADLEAAADVVCAQTEEALRAVTPQSAL